MLYPIIRSALFKIDPERAHKLVLKILGLISGTPLEWLIRQNLFSKPIKCMGLTFKNALGLAAGLDKNGECIQAFSLMGFGFIEVGTVTPYLQLGNKKPRLFRLVEAEGIINRMGFNNIGVDGLIENIKKSKFKGILGINIGKNKNTPIEYGKEDYLTCIEKVYKYASYISINISSPNTLDLRKLQYGSLLEDLLLTIKAKQKFLAKKYFKYVPIVVKISPDLSEEELIKIADNFIRYKIDGVIATNSSINKNIIKGLNKSQENGGLSGRPIQLRSTEVIKCLFRELRGRIPIIGVGGIDSLIAMREKMIAGASLGQIYSGLIYKGPILVKNIVNNL
ncbi:quinone-dependent dihydroorotate dehydrogenase [Candidatus Ishikawella capsulata]|uniref:Dihydroorotate dehydrogenase (quinone) n=1 Tax=Candidatus Ishikawaella capsulata Mpkobe TaxID=476281 RepID=C5WDM4_9ENTR|nr:quinone-dependent dihydroorotate dehydrogenase [Candidatus Ishikawaella capsulata]BAH83430.1 dihydroorotate dehydrogenase [Candidatus Ishikawaella capsulata Mpkobe]